MKIYSPFGGCSGTHSYGNHLGPLVWDPSGTGCPGVGRRGVGQEWLTGPSSFRVPLLDTGVRSWCLGSGSLKLEFFPL